MEQTSHRFPRVGLAIAVATSLIVIYGLAGSAIAQKRGKAPEPTGSSSDLAERVQQLESQLVEMRVVIDTMASLSQRGHSGAPPPGEGFAGAPRGDARIDVLETQMRAITSQMEQLANEVRGLSGGQPVNAGTPRPSGGAWQTRVPQPQGPSGGAWLPQPQAPEVRGFESRAEGASTGDANRSYLQAINLYNQDDFQGAADALATFIQAHPNHPQLPTAQYRLAQSNFKLAQYATAAKQFWGIVRQFPNEPVAPDSFAMFAASLGKSGRSKDACEAYQQHRSRYPNDALHMPVEAKTEQSRLRC